MSKPNFIFSFTQISTFLCFLAPLCLTGLSACNTFDPSLGNAPFRCGEKGSSQRCPESYTCVTYAADNELCEADSSAGTGGNNSLGADAAPAFVCANDKLIEPNNTLSEATRAIIPECSAFSLAGVAICAEGDKDFFRFEVGKKEERQGDPSHKKLVVDIEHLESRGALQVEIITQSGNLLAVGKAVSGNKNKQRVTIPNINIDTYFVRVSAVESTTKNNYSIDIKLINNDPNSCN